MTTIPQPECPKTATALDRPQNQRSRHSFNDRARTHATKDPMVATRHVVHFSGVSRTHACEKGAVVTQRGCVSWKQCRAESATPFRECARRRPNARRCPCRWRRRLCGSPSCARRAQQLRQSRPRRSAHCEGEAIKSCINANLLARTFSLGCV